MADLDLTQFLGALWNAGADPVCPSCGAIDWRGGSLTTMPQLDPTTQELNYEDGLPVVALLCTNCFFVRLHAVDLTKEAEPKLGMGSNGASG